MSIVDRLPIDSGATLLIVDIKGKQLLLSVSGKETRLLKELTS